MKRYVLFFEYLHTYDLYCTLVNTYTEISLGNHNETHDISKVTDTLQHQSPNISGTILTGSHNIAFGNNKLMNQLIIRLHL